MREHYFFKEGKETLVIIYDVPENKMLVALSGTNFAETPLQAVMTATKKFDVNYAAKQQAKYDTMMHNLPRMTKQERETYVITEIGKAIPNAKHVKTTWEQ